VTKSASRSPIVASALMTPKQFAAFEILSIGGGVRRPLRCA